MGKTCNALIAAVLTALFGAPQFAYAWGNEGHEAVACIAWQRLSEPVKSKVFALLQQVPSRTTPSGKTIPGFKEWSQDMPKGLTEDQQHMYVFMRAATWADSIKHVGLQDSDTPPADFARGASNLGFTDHDSHGYWHFVDTPGGTPKIAKSPVPSVPKNCWTRKAGQAAVPPTPVSSLPDSAPVPNAASEIAVLSTALASAESPLLKAYDMIWLEHLVGDIHQPLHASNRFVNGIADIGGNCVAISVPESLRGNFASSSPKSKPPTELHAFWDDLPGVGQQMETSKAVAYAATLIAADDDKAGISDPNIWAKESFDMAFKDAYALPIGAAFGSPTPYRITDDYYNTAANDAKTRIALAGARLANLLKTELQ